MGPVDILKEKMAIIVLKKGFKRALFVLSMLTMNWNVLDTDLIDMIDMLTLEIVTCTVNFL